MRPVYVGEHDKRNEDRVLRKLRPVLRKWGERELGGFRQELPTHALAPCEWLMDFEHGALLIEVKHRSAKFSDYMISERKIHELHAYVCAERKRGRHTHAIVCVSVPDDDGRAVYLFTTDTEPVARRYGGRYDRWDAGDSEYCLHYDWDDMQRMML